MAGTGFKSAGDLRPDERARVSGRRIIPGLTPEQQTSLDRIEAELKQDPALNKAAEKHLASIRSNQLGQPSDESEAEANRRRERERAAYLVGVAESHKKGVALNGDLARRLGAASEKKTAREIQHEAASKSQKANAAGKPGPAAPNGPKPAQITAPKGMGQSLMRKLKRRRTQAYIAVASVVMVISILGFFLAIPFKLIHIVHVLKDHNAQNNEHTTDRTQRKLLQRLLLDAKTADGGTKSRTGRPLHDFLTNHRIAKFDKILSEQGVKMNFDKSGKLASIEKNGTKISNFEDQNIFQKNGTIYRFVGDTLDTRNILKRVLYTKALRVKSRVSFKFWAIDKGKSLKEWMAGKVMKGATPGEGFVKGSTGGAEPAKVLDANGNETPASKTARAAWAADQAAAQKASLGDVSDAVRAEADEFNKSFDKLAARKAAIASFRASPSGKLLGWTGIATLYCMVRQIVLAGLDKHYIERADRLMREGNLLVTQAHEMEAGHIPDLSKWDEFMRNFDGDPKSDPTKAEEGKSFDQAAAWKRNTGEPVHTDIHKFATYNPDLSPGANPSRAVLSNLQQLLADFLEIPGEAAVCKVLQSWVGWVISGIEVVLAIADGESTTAAAAVAKGILMTVAIEYIVPVFVDQAANLTCVGVGAATEFVNCADGGLNLSEKEYGRLLGDRQGTDAENTTITMAAQAEQNQVARDKGWAYRAFAIDNNNSILSKAIEKVPTSPNGAVAAITPLFTSFTDIPGTMKRLAASFFAPRTALAGPSQLDPYGFQPQVTTDQEVDNSDPFDYEDYLYQPVTKADGTQTTRVAMLGDPSTYSPDNNLENGDDTNSQDLMHCFVNKFRDPTDGTSDSICRSLGYITKPGANPITTATPPDNPGQHEIVDLIYCQANQVCGLSWMHTFSKRCFNDITKICGSVSVSDFDTYRIYLKYVMLGRGFEGAVESYDPFSPGAATGDPFMIGRGTQ